MTTDPYKDLPSLDTLQREIDKAAGVKAGQEQIDSNTQQSMGQAMRLSVELLAGVLVGGFIGYHLDNWLGTLPLFLIVCFFLGAAAGFRNIVRDTLKTTQTDNNETDSK